MSNMNLHQSQSHEVLRSWQTQRTDVNHHKDFVLPLFVGNDDNSIEAIESMPGVYRYGSNRAIEYLEPLVNTYGLRAILLFPVVTKSDQAKLEAQDDDDEDSDARSSSVESNSSEPPSSSSLSGSSSDDDDDGDQKRVGQMSVMPERLMPEDEALDELTTTTPATTTTAAASASMAQNPFLNQNEEEEDHLLVEDMSIDRMAHDEIQAASAKVRLAEVSMKKSRRKQKSGANKVELTTKSRDVRLIRGLALKEENNPVLRMIPRLRTKFPQLLIICDVCLCTFTSTGHCCLFDEQMPTISGVGVGVAPQSSTNHAPAPLGAKPAAGQHHYQASAAAIQYPISNKVTCQYLALLALEYARRGCNVVAPSDMMDGRIRTIREKLDENQLHHVSILSYSAKFASAFYGPFRQATMNAPEFGDRRAYQLPPGSRSLAMKAVERDIKQGADFVMVKPAGAYLDIVRDLRETHPNVPIAVYQVSGEYSMLKIAANANVIDLKAALNEVLTAYRRAGATIIISYFTPEILRGEL